MRGSVSLELGKKSFRKMSCKNCFKKFVLPANDPYGPEMDEQWWDRSKNIRATRVRGEKKTKNWPKVQKSRKNSDEVSGKYFV